MIYSVYHNLEGPRAFTTGHRLRLESRGDTDAHKDDFPPAPSTAGGLPIVELERIRVMHNQRASRPLAKGDVVILAGKAYEYDGAPTEGGFTALTGDWAREVVRSIVRRAT